MEQQLREWMEKRLQDVWEDSVRTCVGPHAKLQKLKERMQKELWDVWGKLLNLTLPLANYQCSYNQRLRFYYVYVIKLPHLHLYI